MSSLGRDRACHCGGKFEIIALENLYFRLKDEAYLTSGNPEFFILNRPYGHQQKCPDRDVVHTYDVNTDTRSEFGIHSNLSCLAVLDDSADNLCATNARGTERTHRYLHLYLLTRKYYF